MVLFDTNAILRYLLQDIEEQADAVNKLLETETCLVTIEVTVEVVYVLHKVYKIDRKKIREAVKKLIQMEVGLLEKPAIVSHAMDTFATTKLDVIDCMLIGYAKAEGFSVFTFDKTLKGLLSKG